MPDAMASSVLLALALLACLCGMGWLALAMPVHAAQAWGRVPGAAARRLLRWGGCAWLGVALALCLRTDHASMATLVWIMAMTAAALSVAAVLAMRPHWLGLLAPWCRPRGDAPA